MAGHILTVHIGNECMRCKILYVNYMMKLLRLLILLNELNVLFCLVTTVSLLIRTVEATNTCIIHTLSYDFKWFYHITYLRAFFASALKRKFK